MTSVRLGWLADGSEREVRRALAAAMPDLGVEKLTVLPRNHASNPLYWSSSAFVNDDLVMKFAWSQVRAVRLHREGVLLQRLAARAPGLRLPELVAFAADPVVVVTKQLAGEPLSWGAGSDLSGRRLERVACDLADFLQSLHMQPVAEILGELPAITPTAQADTALLRARYGHLVDDERATVVHGWCDWVDGVLVPSDPDAVLVHGDLHGHNQLWDSETGDLVAVLDLEECGVGDRHFDFRYLPGNSSSTELLLAVVDAYERRSGVRLNMERIMAWHVLTVLGDARWRTEAGLELPGGGDACSYVDEVDARLDALRITTTCP